MSAPRITVCTPTWQRAHTLRRPFDSLQRQTFRSFEWILWDDGSTDDTPSLAAALQAEASFPMVSRRWDNRGKFSAVNAAAQEARGELFVILDSDDALLPDALDTFWRAWTAIPEDARARCFGLCALCVTPDGRVFGDRFPANAPDASFLHMRTRWNVGGEKCEAIVTDALRAFPYPTFPGEKHVPPSMIFFRASREGWWMRFVDTPVRVYEVLADGITASSVRTRIRNAAGYCAYYREFIDGDAPIAWRARHAVNLARFSAHRGASLAQVLSELRTPAARAALLAAWPVGQAAALRDRLTVVA